MSEPRRHLRRSVRALAGAATAVLAVALVGPTAGASNDAPYPITVVPPATRAALAPPVASVTISPGSGLPGTAIDVQLTVTPSGACGIPAVALRSGPTPSDQSAIVDLDLFLQAPTPGAPFAGTLVVPSGTAPGTVLFVDGGCAGTTVISPAKTFVVTAAPLVATPVVVPPAPRR